MDNKLKNMRTFTKNILSSTKTNRIGLRIPSNLWEQLLGVLWDQLQVIWKIKSTLTDSMFLISVGIILIYYNENKDKLSKVLELIKERKLIKRI